VNEYPNRRRGGNPTGGPLPKPSIGYSGVVAWFGQCRRRKAAISPIAASAVETRES
jgi:hypothetical protein